MLKGFYAIGVLASDVESYSAVDFNGKAVEMKINSMGGLTYKGNYAIITLTINGASMQFKAVGTSLSIYSEVK